MWSNNFSKFRPSRSGLTYIHLIFGSHDGSANKRPKHAIYVHEINIQGGKGP